MEIQARQGSRERILKNTLEFASEKLPHAGTGSKTLWHIINGKALRYVAAAGILAVMILAIHEKRSAKTVQITQAAVTNSSILKEISWYKLQMAFNAEGMEGIEKNCKKANEDIWPEIKLDKMW